jgi:myo-inositol-1(or 4)-monophosphatase
MRAVDAESYARLALDVAKRAAAVALEGFRKGAAIERKGGTELVTPFDFASEEVVREGLRAAAPEVPVIAEETGGEADGDRVWYADPIDGTTNFAHGHPFWAVSIGLVVRGVPVAGAVVAPALGLEWLAWMGGPALRNGHPCRVSAVRTLSDALLATGFPYDRHTNPDNNVDAFSALQKKAVGIRRCGSAAIDLCLVADGTYDGYWERSLRPWDIAAGIAVARAAGATVSSFHHDAPDITRGHVIASNGQIHRALVKELRRVRKSHVA